jgi:crotonobetainyl-CoA:carnitine CoA-transferase CaiB-like acyl-CoA transferase
LLPSIELCGLQALAALFRNGNISPGCMAARPPEFGEQTDEILKEFDFNADEVANLRQRKIV